MNVHLVVPYLFGFPAAGDLFAGLRLPALARLLSRGDSAVAPPRPLHDWLLEAWRVPRQADAPVAPLTLEGDGGDPGDAWWLRADPVHFRVDRDSVTLADAAAFPLDDTEVAQLVKALNRHFSGEGLAFLAPHPQRWYLRLAAAPDLVTRPLPEATGRSACDSVAGGGAAAHWRRLETEMQMVLHGHPVNEAREAAGRPTVNGVWLWGGGRDPGAVARRFAAVASRDPLARALARRSGAALVDPPQASALLDAADGDALAALDDLAGATQYGDAHGFRETLALLEQDWFAPLLAALERGRIARLAIHPVPATRRVDVTPAALRRFWRRIKPMAALTA